MYLEIKIYFLSIKNNAIKKNSLKNKKREYKKMF